MKALKRMFPLLLVMALTLGLFPMGALAVGDGTVPVETSTPSEAPSADTGSEDPPEPVDPFEPGTTPPGEVEPSSWEDTASPQPVETEQPETEASPSQVPEDDPSIIDGVSYYGQPWGEGIFYGPDDLSGAGPMTIAASGTVTIAVKGCTDSSGKAIKRPTVYPTEQEVKEAVEHPAIVHFSGCCFSDIRPWLGNSDHPYAQAFMDVKARTPWCEPLYFPDKRSRKHRIGHWMYKHLPHGLYTALMAFGYQTILPWQEARVIRKTQGI